MFDDPLSNLSRNKQISESCSRGLQALDDLSWDRDLRNASTDFVTHIRRMCGYASAALDGASLPSAPTEEPDSSPMGQLSNLALVMTAQADELVKTFAHSPFQVWARLHSLNSEDSERGVPRVGNQVNDVLHLGELPDATQVVPRLTALANLIVNSEAPAVLVSAIAHAEIATLRPFNQSSYIVARATGRLILMSRGVDPRGFACLEIGLHQMGRTAYSKALRNYTAGNMDDMAQYVETFVQALESGILHTRATFEATK